MRHWVVACVVALVPSAEARVLFAPAPAFSIAPRAACSCCAKPEARIDPEVQAAFDRASKGSGSIDYLAMRGLLSDYGLLAGTEAFMRACEHFDPHDLDVPALTGPPPAPSHR